MKSTVSFVDCKFRNMNPDSIGFNEPFKAMMPHEFLEALHPEYPDGE